jgi:spermidine/putrescine transport system ATP-binding protein
MAQPAADAPRPGSIQLDRVTKVFGRLRAVDRVSLDIPAGEFFSLLGPSGCGKTTILRMIAGFEDPTSGRILLDGVNVSWVRPAKRNVNMVFQAYGLFPHMTVAANVAYGLRVKHVPRDEIARRVDDVLRIVRLSDQARRRPSQLSGGQQQRVALARALVNRPAALLLDEPLGALDLKLRKEMQLELKAIHAQTGMTFVYVTHDQEEALTMSTRIAVMRDGVVEQVATPRDLYERPASPFVAGFIGTSNLIAVEPTGAVDGLLVADLGDGERIVVRAGHRAGQQFSIVVRPEKMRIWGGECEELCSFVSGVIEEVVYLGSVTQFVVRLRTGEAVSIHELNDDLEGSLPAVGQPVHVRWAAEHSYIVASGPQAAPAVSEPT